MKNVILLVISLFICIVAMGQDDMYKSKKKTKKEKIEVSVFGQDGHKINVGEKYSGVVLVSVKQNGEHYTERRIFWEEELTKNNMYKMAEEIIEKKRTEEFREFCNSLHPELYCNNPSKSDTLIYVDGSTLMLITKDSNGEITIPTSVADRCNIIRGFDGEIKGYSLIFNKIKSDLRATYKDVYETKDGGKTYEHKRVIDKVDEIKWNSYDDLYISLYTIDKIKKWNTNEFDYLLEVEDAKDKFNFDYEELKNKKIMFNCTKKTKKKLETTVSGDLLI